MQVTRINEFQAADGKAEELWAFLQSLIPYISASPGCISCEALRNEEDPQLFVVLEKWASAAQHRASIAAYPKEKMLAVMPLFGAAPKGAYYHL